MKVYYHMVSSGITLKEFDRSQFEELSNLFSLQDGVKSVSVVNDNGLRLLYEKNGEMRVQASGYEGWERISFHELEHVSKSTSDVGQVSGDCNVLVDHRIIYTINEWQGNVEHDKYKGESNPELANYHLEDREEYLEKLEELMTDKEYETFKENYVSNAPSKVY